MFATGTHWHQNAHLRGPLPARSLHAIESACRECGSVRAALFPAGDLKNAAGAPPGATTLGGCQRAPRTRPDGFNICHLPPLWQVCMSAVPTRARVLVAAPDAVWLCAMSSSCYSSTAPTPPSTIQRSQSSTETVRVFCSMRKTMPNGVGGLAVVQSLVQSKAAFWSATKA